MCSEAVVTEVSCQAARLPGKPVAGSAAADHEQLESSSALLTRQHAQTCFAASMLQNLESRVAAVASAADNFARCARHHRCGQCPLTCSFDIKRS
jgi:uncharacterized protein YllA (UPF0747 family)